MDQTPGYDLPIADDTESDPPVDSVWTPTPSADERFWRERLDRQLEPLLDSLQRLRERDLLD